MHVFPSAVLKKLLHFVSFSFCLLGLSCWQDHEQLEGRHQQVVAFTTSEKEVADAITHVLLVKPQWLDKLLSGEKRLELRGSHTHKRGLVGLGTKTQLVGYARLTGSRQLSAAEVVSLQNEHCCPPHLVTYGTVFGWSFEGACRFSAPQALLRKQGQVMWACKEPAKACTCSSSQTIPDSTGCVASDTGHVKESSSSSTSGTNVPPPPVDIEDTEAKEEVGGGNGSENTVLQTARDLKAANSMLFQQLFQVAPRWAKHGTHGPRGKVPSVETFCTMCQRPRHSCMWSMKRVKHGAVTNGGVCYACIRSCKLFSCCRSVGALREVGLLPIIQKMSAAVAKALPSDLCQCAKQSCTEKRALDVD